MAILLDTSMLLATIFERDQNYAAAADAMREIRSTRLVVEPVVIEAFFLTAARISFQRAIRLFEFLQTPAFEIVPLTAADRQRMVEIMWQFQDAKLDIADVAQVAAAEHVGSLWLSAWAYRKYIHLIDGISASSALPISHILSYFHNDIYPKH